MTIMPRLAGCVVLFAGAAAVASPMAEAQTVNPYKPLVTRPPGQQDPAVIGPGQHGLQGNRTGVIAPPRIGSHMPVIHPTTPSRMPVIHPPVVAPK
jgi:hypothetical protein